MKHEFKNGDKVRIKGLTTDRLCYYVGPCPARSNMHVLMPVYATCNFQVCSTEYIEPHKEPIKVSGWVNVYENGVYTNGPSFHATREDADFEAWRDRVACVYVTGTEGEEP